MSRDFAFVHAADVHIDSPLNGLASKNTAFSHLVRGATRRAFANVVDLAIQEKAAFLVIAGDLYDGTWKDQNTGQYVIQQLGRLNRAGIRAVVVFGNHDAENRITRHLQPPDGVHFLSNTQCETVKFDDLGVAIHGRSYKQSATTEDISRTYCEAVPNHFNIAALHTALDGHPGHANYAPCKLEYLRSTDHHYWALGHVHERSVRSSEPYVVFPGNTQGRHVRETGAKGATLVQVREGEVESLEHRACDEARWAQIAVSATDARDMNELLHMIRGALQDSAKDAGDRPVAVRVSVQAQGSLRRPLLRDPDWFSAEVQGQAHAVSDTLWIESVRLSAGGVEEELPQELADLLVGAESDEDCARLVLAAVRPLLDKLPPELNNPDVSPLLAAARAGDTGFLIAAAREALEARLAVEDD